MTKEEFRYLIDLKKPYEFSFNGTNYNLTFAKEDDGKDYIYFGERYFQKKYKSYGELINEAKVENHYLKEILDVLN